MSADHEQTTSERRPDWAAFCIGLGLIALAALIGWDMSRLGGAAAYARIGPQTIPYAIAACLVVLGIWTMAEGWRGLFPARDHVAWLPVLWIVGGLLAQIVLLRFAGFSIATGILFAFTARGLGKVRLWLALVAGIVFSFAVWFVFARLLQLSLPAGPLEQLFIPGTR